MAAPARLKSIPLRMSVAAGSSANLASRLILIPFDVVELFLIFPPNTSNKLRYRFFTGTDPNPPTTGLPSGIDVFTDTVAAGEFVGESIAYSVPVNVRYSEQSLYLYFHVDNDTTAALIAACVVLIAV